MAWRGKKESKTTCLSNEIIRAGDDPQNGPCGLSEERVNTLMKTYEVENELYSTVSAETRKSRL